MPEQIKSKQRVADQGEVCSFEKIIPFYNAGNKNRRGTFNKARECELFYISADEFGAELKQHRHELVKIK